MKRFFGLQFTAIICCFAMMMMSCTDDDTKGQLTPEEKEKAEFFEKIKDPRIDYSVAEILGCVRAYEFNEDGTFNAASIVGWDDNDNGDIADEERDYYALQGQWMPVKGLYCEEADETFDALYVKYKTIYIEEDGKEIEDVDSEEVEDIIYLVPSDAEGGEYALVWHTDLLAIAASYNDQNAASRRSIFGDWFQAIKKVAPKLVKPFETVGKGLVKMAKAVAKGFEKAGQFALKVAFNKYPLDLKGNANWMGEVFKDQNPLLRDISLPGTHDTFTYDYGRVYGAWAKTQAYNVEDQFTSGIRFFDFRFKYTSMGNFRMCHGINLTSINLDEAFKYLIKMLKDNPQETVVICLKFEEQDMTQERIDELKKAVNRYKDHFVPSEKVTADLRLNDCRGKMVVFQRFPESMTPQNKEDKNNYKGATDFVYANHGSENDMKDMVYQGKTVGTLMTQDKFECDTKGANGTFDFQKKVEEMAQAYWKEKLDLTIANMNDAQTPKKNDTWHFIYASGFIKTYLTFTFFNKDLGGIPFMSYERSANYMNKAIADHINANLGKKTGFVIMDFGGIHTFGAVSRTDVYGDNLVTALINNNKELVKKGAFK